MKKIIIVSVIFLLTAIAQLDSQVIEQYAIASRMFYFNSGGLVNQTPELLSPRADSQCSAESYSMKTLAVLDGVFYQALGSAKFEAGFQKTALRKSSDGINWNPLVKAGDSPAGKYEYYQNIYLWKKNNNVNVGIMFVDNRSPVDQVRFVKSTNGGASFLPSVPVSSYSTADQNFLGGITGKGDTVVACWARVGSVTMFSRSVDGGATWSAMSQVFSGGFFSICTDITMDNSGTLYAVIAEDQFFKVNLVVRKSTDLGASWSSAPPITSVSIQQMNQFQQCRFFNNKLYVMWERNLNTSSHYSDGIFLTESSNGASSWSAPVDITDTDTLYESDVNFPLGMHPSFTVTPGGVMYAVWADSRVKNAPVFDSCKFNIYLSRSTNGGVTWSQNIPVNGPSNYSRTYNELADISVKSSGGVDSVLVTWSKLRDVSVIGIIQTGTAVPGSFSLSQNYPNPFNPSTIIKLGIKKQSKAKLSVYDITGKEIDLLVDGILKAGEYEVSFDARTLPSGIYFYKLITDEFSETRKMVLVK
jgi:hypothetical protein